MLFKKLIFICDISKKVLSLKPKKTRKWNKPK